MLSYFSSCFPTRGNKDDTANSTRPKPPQSQNDTTTLPVSPTTGSQDRALMFTLGAASGMMAVLAWRRWGMRLRTAEWVTPNELARRRWIRGVVTSIAVRAGRHKVVYATSVSVGDADDFRLYHTPGFGWRWPLRIRRVPTKRKDLTDQTIHVRIAGIDAPECPHGRLPGQPHGKESLAWLRSRVHGKTLYCQLMHKDRYGRIIGIPLVPRPFLPLFLCRYFGSPLAIEMLRTGTAMVYTESGGEYRPWGREKLLLIEKEAKAARIGMWRNGGDIETPGEYKKRYSSAFGSTEGRDDVTGDAVENERDGESGLLTKLTKLLK